MSIDLQCESCQQRYRVRDELAGKRVRCKACSAVVTVPMPPAAEEPELVVEPEAEAEQQPAYSEAAAYSSASAEGEQSAYSQSYGETETASYSPAPAYSETPDEQPSAIAAPPLAAYAPPDEPRRAPSRTMILCIVAAVVGFVGLAIATFVFVRMAHSPTLMSDAALQTKLVGFWKLQPKAGTTASQVEENNLEVDLLEKHNFNVYYTIKGQGGSWSGTWDLQDHAIILNSNNSSGPLPNPMKLGRIQSVTETQLIMETEKGVEAYDRFQPN